MERHPIGIDLGKTRSHGYLERSVTKILPLVSLNS
jgi:hypothetical protein